MAWTFFDAPAFVGVYPLRKTYTAGEYIDLLSTYSDHIALPALRRVHLFGSIEALIRECHPQGISEDYKATAWVLRKLA